MNSKFNLFHSFNQNYRERYNMPQCKIDAEEWSMHLIHSATRTFIIPWRTTWLHIILLGQHWAKEFINKVHRTTFTHDSCDEHVHNYSHFLYLSQHWQATYMFYNPVFEICPSFCPSLKLGVEYMCGRASRWAKLQFTFICCTQLLPVNNFAGGEALQQFPRMKFSKYNLTKDKT